MRIKRVCKLCIDIGMLVITFLLMASERTGIVLHMFLGAALFVLVVAHNISNLAWWADIGKGSYSRTRWVRSILNVLLLIDFLLVMVSGILYAVGLHRITALLFLILTILHIRVYWKKASAVTAYTYGKNKNLDIKNGLVMMASVVAFTILGSWLSSLLPNAVLGGSSYVMTFIMGVRFLVSPITKTTSRMDEIEPKKRIIRSLLSGIHIGLFCGFVGAGGGVLLLITLTSVLGYSLKTAVGTSTFIMIFTALIGARASALFANKVDAKKQNRVTGVALCGLGAVLALVNWL